jgi:hypothetical protein
MFSKCRVLVSDCRARKARVLKVGAADGSAESVKPKRALEAGKQAVFTEKARAAAGREDGA